MQEQGKFNQVILEQMQVISVQIVNLTAQIKGGENSNAASTSRNHDKLPIQSEVNPREEVKAIIM
jgi:hypothetical protein